MRTGTAAYKDVPELKLLWKEAFGDDDAYIDAFFEDLFSPKDFAVLRVKDRIVSMAALLPCTLVLGDAEYPISYLYAMCTAKDMRGKGCGLRLLDFAASYCLRRSDRGIALLPADEGLHKFYAKAGYEKAFSLLPNEENYIKYTENYLRHCRRLDEDKAADASLQGVFLPLCTMPEFSAYMPFPMD